MRRLLTAGVAVGLALAGAACRRPGPPPRTRLVVALPMKPGALPPQVSMSEATNTVFRHVYEPLTDLTPDLRVMPCLAESWYCPDERTWVFHLRKGVRRHDGRLLDARDAAVQLDRTFGGTSAAALGLVVTSVSAPDSGTLVLRTASPAGWLPNYLAYVYLRFDGAGPGPAVGTGPYVYGGEGPDGTVILDAFEGHRDGRPKIERVEFHVLPDLVQARSLLRRGDVHLVLDVPEDEWEEATRDPALRTISRPGLRVVYLGFNTLSPGWGGASPLRDPRLRRAIAGSIDRRAIIRDALGGLAEPIVGYVPPEVFGHVPGLEAVPPLDRQAARASLAGVGRPPRPLVLGYPMRQRAPAVAARIAADLRAIGLDVETTRTASFGPRSSPGDSEPDLYLAAWSNATGDASFGYHALAHTPDGKDQGSLSGFSRPVVDRLLAAAAVAPSQIERLRTLREVATTLAAEVALVPLYRVLDRYAYAAGLEFSPRLDRRLRVQDMRWVDPPRGARLP